MLGKLPESAPDRKRSFGGTALSTLLHALLIGGTVAATGSIAEQALEKPIPTDIVYVEPTPSKPVVTPPETRQQQIPTDIETPLTPVENTIDRGRIPDVLPPSNTISGTIYQDDFRVSRRDSVPVGPAIPATNEVLTELMVEQVVRPLTGNPAPRYPSMLASAGVEGLVYAQFVVDTAGRVEAESIRFPKSDHPLFERSVRDVLLRSRFSPAQVGKHPVRQLVEQAFSFALKR
jgi:protein TonB